VEREIQIGFKNSKKFKVKVEVEGGAVVDMNYLSPCNIVVANHI